jgi:high affinity sulfate transporter 1
MSRASLRVRARFRACLPHETSNRCGTTQTVRLAAETPRAPRADRAAAPGHMPCSLGFMDPSAHESAAGIDMPPLPPLPKSGLSAWLPGLWILRHYRRAWLGRDIAAGFVLTALLVPAGMGYAVASGLPPVTGLYATIGPLLAYAIFGPSRIMVVGPDSALAPLIASALLVKGAAGDPARAVALASMLALLTGALCIGAGLARAGLVTDLLSKPVRVGYLNGVGLTVLVTQLPKLFGFSIDTAHVATGATGFVQGVMEGKTNPVALAIGCGCLAILVAGKLAAPRVPAILVAVVVATLAVTALGLEHRVAVVGSVPAGVPIPGIPAVSLADAGDLLIAAVGIAMMSFADTSVISRTFAARHGHRVDANRELIGLGIANLASGVLRGFPISSSATRTPVAESAGSRTQLTGIVGALAIIALLVGAPGLLHDLPTTALAAVVISAAANIIDIGALRVFYRVRRSDFVLSSVAFLGVVIFGVLPGIAFAIGVSLLDVVRRAWRPHDAILGRADGLKGYHDIGRHPEAKQIPGLVLFRWDAPLFFANAETFRARVIDAVDSASEPVKWVVVAAEPITDVDTTAAEMLDELDEELSARGADLAFAEMKGPVKDRLERYGLKKRIGYELFFPTIGVAVKAFLGRHQVAWTDWEEHSKD